MMSGESNCASGILLRGTTTAILGAAALALAVRSSAAAVDMTACQPLDLSNNKTATDYIRWSQMSDRLYLEAGACVTMTDIFESRIDNMGNKGPLYPFDEVTGQVSENVTGSWYLDADLYVIEGSKLVVQGTENGGDCDHLLLASSPEKFINVRAHGGDILFHSTHVESWDMAAGGVDEDFEDGRSYLSAISEVILEEDHECLGMAKNNMGESRLDIIDSEINHLGYYESESYGIAYKVRGFCEDLSNPELFDMVGVYGDITGSNIHHLYFGHYSYGHEAGNFSFNEVHDNVGYGFDPHDDSDGVTINNNHVYNNGWHGIIASKRCDHVSIENNHVHDNGHMTDAGQRVGNGIMLHRSCDFGVIRNNKVHDNMDSGVALYESSSCEVSGNELYNNRNGIRMSMGSSFNLAWDNDIVINGEDEKYAIYLYRGSDEPAVEGSDGRPRNNRVFDNSLISDDVVVMMTSADDNMIEGNTIYGRLSRFKDAINTLWFANAVPDVHEFKMEEGSCFNPDSDMDAPSSDEGYYGSLSYNFNYEHDESYDGDFFCGI